MINLFIVYRVISEWDLGFENELFETEQLAWKNAEERYNNLVYDEEFPEDNFDDAKTHGLLQVESVTIMKML